MTVFGHSRSLNVLRPTTAKSAEQTLEAHLLVRLRRTAASSAEQTLDADIYTEAIESVTHPKVAHKRSILVRIHKTTSDGILLGGDVTAAKCTNDGSADTADVHEYRSVSIKLANAA